MLVFLARELEVVRHLVAGSGGSDTSGNSVFTYVNGEYASLNASALQPGSGYWVKYPTPGWPLCGPGGYVSTSVVHPGEGAWIKAAAAQGAHRYRPRPPQPT